LSVLQTDIGKLCSSGGKLKRRCDALENVERLLTVDGGYKSAKCACEFVCI
jgi:hypothetical protein